MRSAAVLAFTVLLTWCAPLWFSAPARADTSVASLGVRSLDGDTDLERRLSNALRGSANAIAGWSVARREASLEQLMLAIGCEEPNEPCLTEIAKTLAAQLLVFGSVSHAADGYELTIHEYDATSKQQRRASARGLKPNLLRGAPARETMLTLLSQLDQVAPAPPVPTTGLLRIHGNLPSAQIAVDGEPAGALDEQGVLTLELSPGQHVVRAAGDALAPAEEKLAVVEPGQTAQVELAITPRLLPPPSLAVLPEVRTAPVEPPRHTLRRAFGWASLGLGAAFAVATIYSWVRIDHINGDADFRTYRNAYPRSGGANGVSNVCPHAARGELALRDPDKAALERHADKLCGEADTLQALQYVFLGGTLAGAGVGTYLLVSARRMERRERGLTIAPRLGSQSAMLEARLRF